MKPILPALFLGIGLSTSVTIPAAAYPVDCAILLCLAGGWPASAECAHARAVFIRRITPWPVEPPLQIWNCPMRAVFRAPSELERLFDARARSRLVGPVPTATPADPNSVQVADQADIDISDPVFDFVRSIRVFEITVQQRRDRDGVCTVASSVIQGSYGLQGDYRRAYRTLPDVPAASDLELPTMCANYFHRSVFVDWHDFNGTYGHEEVHY